MCLKLASQSAGKPHKVSGEFGPNLPQVQFDPLLLRQVLLNIAKNGIEAMPAGGTLTFTSGRDHDRVLVQISDNGEGIASDIMDKIFQPFYSNQAQGQRAGTGHSQTIVTAHQGEIRVESKPHQGTGVTSFCKHIKVGSIFLGEFCAARKN